MSQIENLLATHLKNDRQPEPEREYKFSAFGKWRFDFAWPELMLAVEVDGGTWAGGRHSRGKGYERDCRKMNIGQLEGWMILRFTSDQVRSGHARGLIAAAIKARGAK